MVVLAGVVAPVGFPVRRWVAMRVPSIRTTSPPCLATFFRAWSSRGAYAARTITAIFPGGRIRHLDRITLR
jgi:hypothetical protein